MSSSCLPGRGLLLLAVVACILTVATSQDNPFTWVDCQTSVSPSLAPSPSSSSANSSTFRSNVAALLHALPSAAATTGFAALSRGTGAGRAFVRGLCRGDAAPADCAAYLRSAAAGIVSRCNASSLRAAIWYDKCFVSYGDTNESTDHEDTFRQILYNSGEVSDKDAFEKTYYALMGRLAARVVIGSGPALFAMGEAVYDANAPNGTMYGLLQCARDRTAAETKFLLIGYMSPEYAYYGHVSTKSDMFSFGVIVLEMVTGRRNNSTFECADSVSLLSYVWGKWTAGSTIEVVDPSLDGRYSEDDVLNCVEVGLLCVQENPADRPDASVVALMLSSHSMTDERHPPSRPAFVFGSGHSRASYGLPAGAWNREGALIRDEKPSTQPISENEVTISELQPR